MSDQKAYSVNRLPLGLMDFSNIIEKNKIYVDKTSLIYKIACQDSPCRLVTFWGLRWSPVEGCGFRPYAPVNLQGNPRRKY